MSAQNIVSALSDLVANNLTVTQPSPITRQERQMAEHADIVKLMASGQRADYVEKTTLEFGDFTADEESEGEEDPMAVEKEGEEMDLIEMEMVEYWRDNCFLPLIGAKCLLLSTQDKVARKSTFLKTARETRDTFANSAKHNCRPATIRLLF
ncbi:unnamed protein product [Didymodactylos carnosus]|uniref:Uncharacterized protein n=1 Tax=Didymodactylos carnosus TaxID=1234261 RepID=A0A815Z0M6_9BILA|nr:unnamed protein product [Didymodactylos carnosus]CAF1576493.1 unnamed protein product [Didymodactylos carnosus]CAF4347335.1 unnamed protein product [Didymodactylos carnosus]CAF4441716.1 unnamed protein product [Didymodactylos carnosus]